MASIRNPLCRMMILLVSLIAASQLSAQVAAEWKAFFAGSGGGDDQPGSSAVIYGRKSVVVDGQGFVYVTGKTTNATEDVITLKYTPEGSLVWARTFDDGGNDRGHNMAVGSDGSLYIAGFSNDGVIGRFLLLKYDSDGNQQWFRKVGNLSVSQAFDLVLDDQDNAYITGQASTGANNNYLTVKFTSAGNEAWRADYNGASNGDDRSYNLAVDSSYNVYVTGQSHNGTNYDFVTVKYNSDGIQQWDVPFDAGGFDVAFTVDVDAADNVFVSGLTSVGADTDVTTIRYDSDGNIVWSDSYDRGFDDRALNMRVTNNGSVHICGFSSDTTISPNPTRHLVLKYDVNGNVEFQYVGPDRFNDRLTGIDVDPEGNIYVSGSFGTISHSRFSVLKLNSEGTVLWEAILDSEREQVPIGVAFDQNRNVYASGIASNGNDHDILTVKYVTTDPTLQLSRGLSTIEAKSAQLGDADVVAGQWELSAKSGNGAISSVDFSYEGTATPDTALASARLVLDRNGNGERDAEDPVIAPAVSPIPSDGSLSFAFDETQMVLAGESISLVLLIDIGGTIDVGTSAQFRIATPEDVTSEPWTQGALASVVQGNLNISGAKIIFGAHLGLPVIERVRIDQAVAHTDAESLNTELYVENLGGNTLELSSVTIILRAQDGMEWQTPLQNLSADSMILAPGDGTWVYGTIAAPAGIEPAVYEVDARLLADEYSFSPPEQVSDTQAAITSYIKLIDELLLVENALPDGAVGEVYKAWIEVQGGEKPLTVSSGDTELPRGLKLSSDGMLYGSPQIEGSYTLSIYVTDAQGTQIFGDFPLTVSAQTAVNPSAGPDVKGVSILSTSLPAALVGHPYSFQLRGVPSDGIWTLASGSLPSGLALSADGRVWGTLNAAAEFPPFTVELRAGNQSSRQVLTVLTTSDRLEGGTQTGLGAGSASGVNVDDAATAPGGVYDLQGQRVMPVDTNPDPQLRFVDLTSDDAFGPVLQRAAFYDRDGDGASGAGDLVRLWFNEALDLGSARVADFSLSAGNFGSGAQIGLNGGSSNFDVVLGEGAVIDPGVTQVIVNAPTQLEDPAGNAGVAATVLVEGPELLQPGVDLFSLNGETLEELTQVAILWGTRPASEEWQITIDLQDASGTLISNLAVSLPDSGRFNWTVPIGLVGGSYQIALSGLNVTRGQSFTTQSAQPFTVVPFGTLSSGEVLPDRSAFVRFVSPTSASTSETGTWSFQVELIAIGGASRDEITLEIYDTLEGDAASGVDYAAFPTTTLTFPAGSPTGTRQTLSVEVLEDADLEENESLVLELRNPNPSNVLAAPTRHRFTITDDDFVARLVVRDEDAMGVEVAYNAVASGSRLFDPSVIDQPARCYSTIYIENPGYLPLLLGTPTITGGGSASFRVDASMMNATVPVGGSTSFEISFVPTGAAGSKAAQVQFTHNARNDGSSPFVFNIAGTAQTFFTLGTTTGVGTGPRSGIMHDLDGDGDLDAAVISVNTGQVSVLLGDGSGPLTLDATYGAGQFGHQMDGGDFNNDGAMDLCVPAWSQNAVFVLMGNGDGTFQAAIPLAVSRAIGAQVGDFNRDGWPDIAATELGGALTATNVHIFLNQGNGTFAGSTVLTGGIGGFDVGVHDLNNDGALDVVTTAVGTGSNSISIFYGIGDGTFMPQLLLPVGITPRSVAFGDLNRDGLTEIVVANGGSNDISILYDDGSETFSTIVAISTGTQPYHVLVHDYDRDGWPDLLTAAVSSGQISLHLGVNGTSFEPRRTIAFAGATYAMLADANSDGWDDLYAISFTGSAIGYITSNMEITCEQGLSAPAALASTPANAASQALRADIDGDGDDDLITLGDPAGGGDQLEVLENDGDGNFTFALGLTLGNGASHITKGDFNRDGSIDFAVSLNGDDAVVLLTNDGMGGLVAGAPLPVSSGPRGLQAADVDHNGALDLIVACESANEIVVLRGVGDASFMSPVSNASGNGPSEIVLGDFDRDGAIDAAVTCLGDDTIEIRLNSGNATFAAAASPFAVTSPGALQALDMNHDGDLDLLVAAQNASEILVLDGDGAGGLTQSVSVATGAGPADFEAFDFNQDGHYDLLVSASGAQQLELSLSDGAGGFAATATMATLNATPVSMLRGDFNRDGLLDLITLHGATGAAEMSAGTLRDAALR